MSLRRVIGAGLLATLLAACASTTRLAQPLEGKPPRTVAVLPLEGGNLPPRGRAIVRRLLGSALQYRRYPTLDDELVDQRLALAGYQPWKTSWLPTDAELVKIGRDLAVDALLLAERFEDARFNAGIFFRRGLEGHLRLLDVASGKTVWSADTGSSGTGGVLLGSGQALKSITETFDAASDATFARHASSIALDVMDLFPESPAPSEQRPRPMVSSVQVTTTRQGNALEPNDRVEIEARATPRSRASATVGGRIVDYPLVEIRDGVYGGTVRVEPGAGEGQGPVTAAIVDEFGTASESRQSDASVSLVAPRLKAPDGLAFDIVESATRRVRLRWNTVQGAKDYLVFRSVRSGESRTLDPVSATQAFDSVPPGSEGALYFVQARVAPGVASAKSAPITVSF